MGDLVVQARGVGKRYDLGVTPSRHARGSLREALSRLPRRAWWAVRRPWRGESAPASAIWGVRGVSFDVNRGEILGIIGPNGSGKSTLLKVTAGITEPTEGWVATRGRVGSLLGVGAGFHPELTGRENVLLNGIILGMRASDVRRRFDEIVAFSGVERLLDTPVKHYSSGMYMRLAFSVAAHLEPDILIVDEVLAVGDAAFQEKCLGKMDEARVQGRTVLFVTHDMASVRRLCTHGLLLRQGRAIDHGPADEVAGRYLAAVDGAAVETGAAPAGPCPAPRPGAPGSSARRSRRRGRR